VSEIWKKFAACRDMSPDVFFPVRGESVKIAKEICSGCRVKSACLEDALSSRQGVLGVAGGTTERERKILRRERRMLNQQ